MMLTVSALANAKPQLWVAAAEDAKEAALHCREVAVSARYVAQTLTHSWPDDAGREARQNFVRHTQDYEAAGLVLAGLMNVYDALAGAVQAAQRTLTGALDYARQHELAVSDTGMVSGRENQQAEINTAASLISRALTDATSADEQAANRLRTIASLTRETDPAMVQTRLRNGADSPREIAERMKNRPDDVHPLNIPPELLDLIREVSEETGISQTLLQAIVWQEQQWYQNWEKDGGPLTEVGRFLDWVAEETFVPDKSLGITHMKIDTAREVIAQNPAAFTTPDGTYLGDLSDAQLAKYIEKYPQEDIRLAAYYLAELKENPYGAATDKQLFLLYATGDEPDMRAKNHQYGDATEPRGGEIRPRAEAWDRLQPRLADAADWASLTARERQQALAEIAADTPRGAEVDLHPVYGSDETAAGAKPWPFER
ncbi:hypothetical protein AB0L88_23210 [Saccharopolyspora shandongensis]|uniref:hypothetical protein n=1 Tax=Saccharopolyspora shandongensis TaxID=418495 RepID=UPI003438D3C3